MEITKSYLIELCEKFLNKEIDNSYIQRFAENAIVNENFNPDDEIVCDTIYEWEDEELNFPINDQNIKLWKERLSTGENKLMEFNNWNFHIPKQKEISEKYNSKWSPFNKKLKVGISSDLISQPLNGLRHKLENGTSGWYIWAGNYSEDDDFFKPLHAEHLLQIKPEIIKYLGLEPGYRFQFDDNGYEDVWRDEKLLFESNDC